jgi:2-polyprenyl-3-methyl-5-hydroxy-6-metoxy-1,4-benzoquinol methylase
LISLVPAEATRILDVGCGAGRLGQALKMERARYVAGIELHESSAAIAATVLDKVLCASVSAVPLEEVGTPSSFDCIIFGDILEHLLDPWEAMRRFVTLLAPNGVVVASIPNIAHLSVIRGLMRGRWEYGERGLLDRTHLRFFTYRSIRELFQQAGLEIVRCERNYRLVERDRRYARLARMLAKGPFKGLFTYQYLIVARPTG